MKAICLKMLLLGLMVAGMNIPLRGALPPYWGHPGLEAKYDWWQDRAAEYEVLFIGASRVYRQVVPSVFDHTVKNRSVRSFNFGLPAFFFPETVFLTRNVLEEGNSALRYIFFGLDRVSEAFINEENMHTRRLVYWPDLARTTEVIRQLWAVESYGRRDKIVQTWRRLVTMVEHYLHAGQVVDVLRYHTGDHWDKGDYLGKDRDGFVALDTEAPTDAELQRRHRLLAANEQLLVDNRNSSMNALDGTYPARGWPAEWTLLRDLYDQAQQQGVRIFFLLPPRLGGGYYPLLPLYYGLPKASRIELAAPQSYPQLYQMNNSFDLGHLNRRGAEEFTRLLAAKFDSLVASR